jgi:hypothetical protein
MTKTILVKAVTRSAAVQKITGALDVKEAEVEAALANCRALINQIDAGLSAKKLFLNISSAAELLFYLEFAASVLKKAAPHPRKREWTKLPQLSTPLAAPRRRALHRGEDIGSALKRGVNFCQ